MISCFGASVLLSFSALSLCFLLSFTILRKLTSRALRAFLARYSGFNAARVHESITQLSDGHRNNTAHYWGSGWPDCFPFLYSSQTPLDFVFFVDLPPPVQRNVVSSATIHVNNNFKKPVNPQTSFLEYYSANDIDLFQKRGKISNEHKTQYSQIIKGNHVKTNIFRKGIMISQCKVRESKITAALECWLKYHCRDE